MTQSRLFLFAVAGACMAATTAAAAPQPAPSSVANHIASFTPPPSPKAVLHAPLGTVINEAFDVFIPVPAATLTNSDSLSKIDCKSANGCTINFHFWGQFTVTSDGQSAFCPLIDGNEPSLACSFLGTIHMADGYTATSGVGSYSVAQGNHQIQTQVYLAGGGSLVSYHYDYELVTP